MTGGAARVLVVGAGPAGSVTAALLAERGWSVDLVDRARFPRPKACGECLNPGAVALLERLGLLCVVEALGPAPLLGWRLRGRAGSTATGTFGPEVGPGLGVPRSALDHALVEAARARGVRLREGVLIRDVRPAAPGAPPVVEGREEGGGALRQTAEIVVGADGLRSVVVRRLDALGRPPRLRKLSLTCRLSGRIPHPDRGLLVVDGDGTVGLAPVERGGTRWNGTVVVDPERHGRAVSSDPGGFFLHRLRAAVPELHPGLSVEEGPWASGPFDWPVRPTSAPGILLVGDAAGYYDPLTGQGIFRALRSAELAARAIDRGLREGGLSRAHRSRYDRALRRAFRSGRRVQRIVEAVVSRPRALDAVVEGFRRSGRTFDSLIRVTGDAAPARSLLRPAVWAPLMGSAGRGQTYARDHREEASA